MGVQIVLLVAAGVAALWSAEQSIVKAMVATAEEKKVARGAANIWALAAIGLLIAAGLV